jgi:hypothetical protein
VRYQPCASTWKNQHRAFPRTGEECGSNSGIIVLHLLDLREERPFRSDAGWRRARPPHCRSFASNYNFYAWQLTGLTHLRCGGRSHVLSDRIWKAYRARRKANGLPVIDDSKNVEARAIGQLIRAFIGRNRDWNGVTASDLAICQLYGSSSLAGPDRLLPWESSLERIIPAVLRSGPDQS